MTQSLSVLTAFMTSKGMAASQVKIRIRRSCLPTIPIVVPREYIEKGLKNRIARNSRESEIKTRMHSTSDPSDPSCSSRCHLAEVFH